MTGTVIGHGTGHIISYEMAFVKTSIWSLFEQAYLLLDPQKQTGCAGLSDERSWIGRKAQWHIDNGAEYNQ